MKGSPYDDMACACCRAFFEGKYADLDAELFSRHREAFPRETFTLDAFLWAVATVRSRVHSPLDGDYVAMVPLADLVGTPSPPFCPMPRLLTMCFTAPSDDARRIDAEAVVNSMAFMFMLFTEYVIQAGISLPGAMHVQVQHSRDGASKWVPQQAGGLFKKGNALVVEARRQVAEGEVITMDFGALPEPKLDSQVLLDYGTMDVDRGQVSFPPAMNRQQSHLRRHPQKIS